MVAEIVNGNLVLKKSLCEALELPDVSAPRIAAVGAGGKTTTLKRLASEYREMGRGSIVTTTTHMSWEASPLFLADPSVEAILAILEKEGCVFAGKKAENGKIKMLPARILEAVLKLENPVLIEADGAKRLPVKFPAAHEPVLLPWTTHVLSVYGLDALGRKIEDASFRPELMADFLNKSMEDILTARDVAKLAQSGRAGRKGVKRGMQYAVVLNKADILGGQDTAMEIWELIEDKKEIKVIVTGQATR